MTFTQEEIQKTLETLNEYGVFDESSKNLRRKIDNIIRSIESLNSKRKNIETEIKKQKKSLESKRMELKKNSKFTTKRIQSTLESGSSVYLQESIDQKKLDDYLLRKSNELLEE